VVRPSTITAKKYDRVSQAYFRAVNSVLGGKTKAGIAAQNLEKELAVITGLESGPPPPNTR